MGVTEWTTPTFGGLIFLYIIQLGCCCSLALVLALDARVKLTSVLISLLLLVFNRYLVSCTVGFVEVGGVLLVSFHVEVYVEEVILKVLPLVWTVQFVPCSVTN